MLSLQSISKSYLAKDGSSKRILNHITLDIASGEVFTLLGPSGCGKSTLLRIIAGLEQPDSGAIFLHNQDITKVPPQIRPVHTIFQDLQLFPHLSVFENIAFGLKIKKSPQELIQSEVSKMFEMFSLAPQSEKKPSELSGGQKQRVALARALILKPDLLLMDEPFSALDPKLKWLLLEEFKSLQKQLGISFVFVTHDQEEAFYLSDRICLISEGQIIEQQKPRDLFLNPQTNFAKDFLMLNRRSFIQSLIEEGR